jgi:hypothetical protein
MQTEREEENGKKTNRRMRGKKERKNERKREGKGYTKKKGRGVEKRRQRDKGNKEGKRGEGEKRYKRRYW